MPEAAAIKSRAATPGQYALIAALAVILAGVLWYQFGSDGTVVTPSDKPAVEKIPEPPSSAMTSPSAVSEPQAPATTALNVVQIQALSWPTISVKDVLRHDPFTLPPLFAPLVAPTSPSEELTLEKIELASEQQQAQLLKETLAGLRALGVGLIVNSTTGKAATIGDRIVQVGDVLGGYRVVEIDSQGIVLEIVPQEKQAPFQ